MAAGPAILVIGPQWVGDLVMAQCLLSALHELEPDAAIDVAAPAWAAPLLKRMPEVRTAIPTGFGHGDLQLRARLALARQLRGLYRSAYVMPGSWKSALVPFLAGIGQRIGYLGEQRYGLLNRIVARPAAEKRRTALSYVRLAGGGAFREPNLTVDGANQEDLLRRFGLPRGGFVALMPGAEFGPAKRWPAGRYAQLANGFSERGLGVALLGSASDRAVTAEIRALAPAAIDLAGQTRLEDAVDLLAAARLAVSNDSGLMHVAAAVGTPVVGLYGSTSPDNTPPLTASRELVWLGLSCSPCHRKICPLGHMNCLNLMNVGQVSDAAGRLLGAP